MSQGVDTRLCLPKTAWPPTWQLLQNKPEADVTEEVLDQLEGALDVLQLAWGRFQWYRMAQAQFTLDQREEPFRNRLAGVMGESHFAEISGLPLDSLSPEDRQVVQEVLGWYEQNEAVRQLLLSVISELWVDYLTRVEALRVSIGLEAYAQRDPLVQYKSKATEMFGSLLSEIRMGVVARMFTLRPRQAAPAAQPVAAAPVIAGPPRSNAPLPPPAANRPQPAAPAGSDGGKKKRRRH